jgi:hypothetical protein
MCLIIVLFSIIPAGSTWARGGHHHHRGWGSFGLGLGLGYGLGSYGHGGYRWGYPGYRFGYGYGYGGYYSPYYAYPPVIAVPSTPPLYIQQGVEQRPRTELPDNYWYYCRKPEGYYPHVKKCPDGWMQVVPQLSPKQ